MQYALLQYNESASHLRFTRSFPIELMGEVFYATIAIGWFSRCLSLRRQPTATKNAPKKLSRQYIDDFLSGDLKTLFDKASPELREAIKNLDALKALRAGSVGEAAKAVDEKLSVATTKIVKSATGQTFAITATVTADGKLIGFFIQPAAKRRRNSSTTKPRPTCDCRSTTRGMFSGADAV